MEAKRDKDVGSGESAMRAGATEPANARRAYMVSEADLPVSCPLPGMTLWNSHPRVYLAFDAEGIAHCPYCGAEFLLRESGERQ